MLNVYLANLYYFKVNRYNLAFTHFLKAYELYRNISVETFPDRHYTQYMIALAYYQFNDFRNAITLGKEIDSIYTLAMASVRRLRLSVLVIRIFSSPRLLRLLSTLIQNEALSFWHNHMPNTSLYPWLFNPTAIWTALSITLPSCLTLKTIASIQTTMYTLWSLRCFHCSICS